jgi:HSP20 family protein
MDMTTEVMKRAKREARGSAENLTDSGDAYLADADIYESEGGLILRLDVPGVEKGQVGIEVDEGDTLQVRAKTSYREETGTPLLVEFRPADFQRSFRIGEGFDKEKIAARLEDGVLEISIPRKESAKPRRIEISA